MRLAWREFEQRTISGEIDAGLLLAIHHAYYSGAWDTLRIVAAIPPDAAQAEREIARLGNEIQDFFRRVIAMNCGSGRRQ